MARRGVSTWEPPVQATGFVYKVDYSSMTMHRILSAFILIGVCIAIFPALPALAQTDPRTARDHIVRLSEDIGGRLAGSANERRAADYIESVLTELGYAATRQAFMFTPEDRDRSNRLESVNIIAVKRGQTAREIIVGAHFDSEVRGRCAGDNAFGVAVMLEAAAAIQGTHTPYTVLFVAFGAEEQGFGGSRYFESTNWSLGDLDGYTKVDAQLGEDGEIWHTRFDTLAYLDENFPGRIDARLTLFNRMLYRALTEFTAP